MPQPTNTGNLWNLTRRVGQSEVSIFAVSDAVVLDNPKFLSWRSAWKYAEHPLQERDER
jgi:hypothetical protein